MAYNINKIVHILDEQLPKVDQRYDGYRDELKKLLGEILLAEYSHDISRTRVVQQVSGKIADLGLSLYEATHKHEPNNHDEASR